MCHQTQSTKSKWRPGTSFWSTFCQTINALSDCTWKFSFLFTVGILSTFGIRRSKVNWFILHADYIDRLLPSCNLYKYMWVFLLPFINGAIIAAMARHRPVLGDWRNTASASDRYIARALTLPQRWADKSCSVTPSWDSPNFQTTRWAWKEGVLCPSWPLQDDSPCDAPSSMVEVPRWKVLLSA